MYYLCYLIVVIVGNFVIFRRNTQQFIQQYETNEQKEAFQQILDQQDNGIIVIDQNKNGKLLFKNAKALSIMKENEPRTLNGEDEEDNHLIHR